MAYLKEQKIAVVYDWIDKWGGVERVLLTLAEMFPQADFYTSYFNKKGAFWAKDLKLYTSFIQRLPSVIKNSRIFSIPFYPYAFESFDFSKYNIIISISSSFAKGIITKPETLHVCYILTPTRYLWVDTEIYLDSPTKKFAERLYRQRAKHWDLIAAQRPDHIISISQAVQERIKKHYRRDSEVIYPPFDLDYWNSLSSKVKTQKSKPQLKSKKFFLVVSRLEPYKRVDLAIDVFNKLGDQLVIIGKGSLLNKLKQQAKNNIVFLADLNDEELASFYMNAQALLMPQEEEFGYVTLEAQFFGCPIIAYKKGGAAETIIEGTTGIFFSTQTKKALRSAVERFAKISYNLRQSTMKYGAGNIMKFSKNKFVKDFKDFIINKLTD